MSSSVENRAGNRAGVEKDETPTSEENHICFKSEWKPHIDSLPPNRYRELFEVRSSSSEEKVDLALVEQACYHYIDRALTEVPSYDLVSASKCQRKFYQWLQSCQCSAIKDGLPMQDMLGSAFNSEYRGTLMEKVKSLGATGEFLCKIGEHLPRILRGELDSLILMNEDGLLERYYTESIPLCKRVYPACARFIDLLAHQNSDLVILEVGAGTGGMTRCLLETLGGAKGKKARFLRYDFTDISAASFQTVKKKFVEWVDLISYRTLDIEIDPVEQGYKPGSYDLIIASNVLHVTTNIGRTMRNVRKLLKPGGRLFLVEMTGFSLRAFPCAMLSSWWQATELHRQSTPTLSLAAWNETLKDAGFSGIDGSLDDYPGDPAHEQSMIVTHNPIKSISAFAGDLRIVSSHPHNRVSLGRLCSRLGSLIGYRPSIISLDEVIVGMKRDQMFIFLDSLDYSVLTDTDSARFRALQSLCSAKSLLWVTEGGTQDCTVPNASIVVGLTRSIRAENTAINLVTLDLSPRPRLPGDAAADMILEVFEQSFLTSRPTSEVEMEFSETDGILHSIRFREDMCMNEFLTQQIKQGNPQAQPFSQEDRPLQATIRQPGDFESICFVGDTHSSQPLDGDEVKIHIKASGVTSKDILIASGPLPGGYLGSECAGVIVEVGTNMTGFSVGDRVCALVNGSFSTFAQCPKTNVRKIPDDMSFAVAASIPVSFCTAYYALLENVRLCKGETVLINTADGDFGDAAIIIAQMIGADVFVIVVDEHKKDCLVDRYRIRREHVFNSRDVHLDHQLAQATGSQGFDVILNSSRHETSDIPQHLASFGRYVSIGYNGLIGRDVFVTAQLTRNVSFSSVDLDLLIAERPQQIQWILDRVINLLRREQIRPISPIISYAISDVSEAFQTLQKGQLIGKLVIEAMDKSIVKVVVPREKGPIFQPDATYIVTGGGGCVGRNIASWMVSHGARFIVLLSRRGASSDKVQNLISSLFQMGAIVRAPACDVAVREHVENVIREVTQTLPPIRGVIHGAMVSKDTSFESSSFEEFTDVMKPKIDGAWNLHNALSKVTLDFFIMLSSLAGIVGHRGQAAYAGASTFLGAFARHRVSQGLSGISIDLGHIRGLRCEAENVEQQADSQENLTSGSMDEGQFHAILHAAVAGRCAESSNHEYVTCIVPPRTDAEAFWFQDIKFRQCRPPSL